MGELKPDEISEFSQRLIQWWKVSGRKFPWRMESDPYKILIAEILLHRTRAENVVSVYLKFIHEFPNLKALSAAETTDILKITRMLGLQWRWNLLKKMVIIIVRDLSGHIPMDRERLLSLPGVGEYIASAVRVFSGDGDDPLIDTNTVRIISRFYGIPVNDGLRRERMLWNLYQKLRGNTDPKIFGFSLIDLAAEVCHPKVPECRKCPLSSHCETFQSSSG